MSSSLINDNDPVVTILNLKVVTRNLITSRLAKRCLLRAKLPMEPMLILGFCSVKRMKVFDPPWMGH